MLKLHRVPAADPMDGPAAEAAGPEPAAARERRRFRRTPLLDRVRLTGRPGDADAPAAELIDGSAGGLFLRVDGGPRLERGESIGVDFDAAARGGTARPGRHRTATVVRCLSHGGAHYVALRFATPDALRFAGGGALRSAGGLSRRESDATRRLACSG